MSQLGCSSDILMLVGESRLNGLSKRNELSPLIWISNQHSQIYYLQNFDQGHFHFIKF